MHHVYILKSKITSKVYVGESGDMPEERCNEHNCGKDPDAYTLRYRPWEVAGYIALNSKASAQKLESYLKTGAGRAFISKYVVEE